MCTSAVIKAADTVSPGSKSVLDLPFSHFLGQTVRPPRTKTMISEPRRETKTPSNILGVKQGYVLEMLWTPTSVYGR